MSQDVSQWLSEINALKQEVARLQSELDAAHASSDRWRQLYNTEAQQRRTETKLNRETIEAQRLQIEQVEQGKARRHDDPNALSSWESELAGLSREELTEKLVELWGAREGDRRELEALREALEAEKMAHEKTRETLTCALGDTVELLKKTGSVDRAKAQTLQLANFNSPAASQTGTPETD
ncbi:hypothetical protein [Oxynema aestuarii]|uniref:Uncharacterized protein n=1 Tax=Oxynema aestuarii AP17 TaxID=2064643 RepID=A0A6H1U3B2_9CYAN|nr:hypothetical protein [Oxynema aestuarii]QIZ72523.1 hypothetical protein HCG48_19615 [Oxynema aestuarii AP17]